jgi:hypothetical protein
MPNNPHKPNPLQRVVRWLARHSPPTHKPLFPSIFGTFCFIAAWLFVPTLLNGLIDHPWGRSLLNHAHATAIARSLVYLFMAFGTYVGLLLWARVIQLCWPDYFDAHEDRHT